MLNVTSDAPQGSVLGPLPFLVYINNLVDILGLDISIRMFANNSILYCISYIYVDYVSDQLLLDGDLKRLKLWRDDWGMEINTNKMSLWMSPNTHKESSLVIIYIINEYKHLGLTVTS